MKRAILTAAAFSCLCAGGGLFVHWQLYLPPECRGDIPARVEFHQGMTLCPGQSAILRIEIPFEPARDDGSKGL